VLQEKEMLLFVHKLKGLLKNSTSVCMMSFPNQLFGTGVADRLQRFSDIACKFTSFLGQTNTEVDPAFADYNGFFDVLKLPKSNSLTCHHPDTMKFVFSRKRHKFVVEVFALPPELTRTTESSSSQASAKLLCQPGPPKPSEIDF
jgi:elongator complex protein 4